ncbi:hypothetical protein ABID22_002327 [Pontibacter aydingkolensis]|uniref:Uncharacterized protein n=1 Tax=Pontibacter aydingkolensis TaxID=1911536 RepID=A0ABS7CVQ2_9BACT|nr:hypothetical protein [Pontibacter aydingkolensis]MBW7467929.1 hypothetical protein [Pontibacter aydingkolensis]
MSNNYQFDRSAYDPYDQNYESGYSGQSREYRDLYNPYKNFWKQALKSKSGKRANIGDFNEYRQENAGRFVPERETLYEQNNQNSGSSIGQQMPKQLQSKGGYHSLTQREGEVFDSGYDVTRRNTYGYRTTGFGPRD